ncbi:hypothetical protein [Dendronalium sp. ChiSLP03b]|uniref:hypothetical protein n=1 Tax=Dendronalium sp. ChiSLP03b TaxID=3075381 RepID=UPI002ADA7AF5|nr:hypothetical protein [Dendronalium sp. ChiSLP03b]
MNFTRKYILAVLLLDASVRKSSTWVSYMAAIKPVVSGTIDYVVASPNIDK